VPAEEPSWWYDETSSAIPNLLSPLGLIWGRIAERRLERARPYRSTLPVICVGNFTAGGTGKTPMSILVATMLAEKGQRVGFLTRGYRGRLKGPHRVDTGRDTANDVGDEPLLLAQHAPTTVSRNRALGAKSIEADGGPAPPTVIVMDDGLQNPDLAKDLALAVVDGRRGFGNGRVIPAGPLRAPLAFQLERADAIIVNRQPGSTSVDAAGADNIASELRRRFPGPVLEARVEADAEHLQLAGTRVVAFAGIANPDRFFVLLESLGAEVVDRMRFGDHHCFTDTDARRIIERAEAVGARLMTTEKDRVRLSGLGGVLGTLRETTDVLPIRLRLESRDAARLGSLLDSALKRRVGANE
jgi:tetraacyldisaccharide 4'-kinase